MQRFGIRLANQLSNGCGYFSRPSSESDKVYFLEHMLVMTAFSIESFIDKKKIDTLVMLKYMLRLAAAVPDHKIVIALFRLQGLILRSMGCSDGALASFKQMRDAAEDIGDTAAEIESIQEAGQTFKAVKDYEAALRVYKRMLQAAWYHSDTRAEKEAYHLIGRVYFHKNDLKQAAFFNSRALRGQLEPATSVLKQMTCQNYARRRQKYEKEFPCAVRPLGEVAYHKVRFALDDNLVTLAQFQHKSMVGYYHDVTCRSFKS